ncbi:uncharacterized protein SOCEGT47_041320 [Sorangium cellulosum]|uniref:Uncharacterized protein n=1 Tax=Sorangium cellulosum TaxID=56 RepID=A0A4P2Q2R3_SORCE|nr:uncharacterized protein SOCEGT47_041320 [Sorangium cellulosum]
MASVRMGSKLDEHEHGMSAHAHAHAHAHEDAHEDGRGER